MTKKQSKIIITLIAVTLFITFNSFGQTLESEVSECIREHDLKLKVSKHYKLLDKTYSDSVVVFYSDSIKLIIAVPDKIKSKVKNERAIRLFEKGLEELRIMYTYNQDSINLEESSINIEALVWRHMMATGTINELYFGGNRIYEYSCKTYFITSNDKEILYCYYDKNNKLFYVFSTIVCSTKNMNFK